MKDYMLTVKKYLSKKIYGTGAEIILRSIEEQKGKLNPKLRKLSNEYAKDVLGSLKYANHLYIYSAIQQQFHEGWIPESYYFDVVLNQKKGDYAKLGELNCLQNKLLGDNVFPDIGYLISGELFTNDFQWISHKDLWNTNNFNKNIVFKTDNSARGEGVSFFKAQDLNGSKISRLADGVFQEYIKQNSFFNQFCKNSVATIRLTTVSRNGSFDLVGAYLRIGRAVDTHVKSKSAIRIPLQLETGMLHQSGYTANWKRINEHPDSNEKFYSKVIPAFRKCADLSIQLHKKMPYINCIGWDMTVDENNNSIPIEWNGYNNDIKFIEATQGPCFKSMKWEKLWKNNL